MMGVFSQEGPVHVVLQVWLQSLSRCVLGRSTGVTCSCCVLALLQVYAWGCGACLGCGSSEATALRPKLIEELAATRIVDISIGDSHCLALSHGKENKL